jgi:hypothetical protein
MEEDICMYVKTFGESRETMEIAFDISAKTIRATP